MLITERLSPLLSPQLGGEHPNSHGMCISPMQKHIDKALHCTNVLLCSLSELQVITTTLFIDTFLDNCDRTDIAVSRLDGDLQAARSEHNGHN